MTTSETSSRYTETRLRWLFVNAADLPRAMRALADIIEAIPLSDVVTSLSLEFDDDCTIGALIESVDEP